MNSNPNLTVPWRVLLMGTFHNLYIYVFNARRIVPPGYCLRLNPFYICNLIASSPFLSLNLYYVYSSIKNTDIYSCYCYTQIIFGIIIIRGVLKMNDSKILEKFKLRGN